MKSSNKMRIVESEVPLNPVRVPRIDEVLTLVDSYPYANKWRLMWLIMAHCGLRPGEVVNLRVDNFSKNFSKLTYRVQKPTRNKDKKKNILHILHKIRTVGIPPEIGEELKYFFSREYYTFRGGKIFNVCQDSLRRQLSDKRHELGEGFLDVYRGVVNGRNRCWYRITCHSFRRFYGTYRLIVNSQKDPTPIAITKTTRDMGHTDVNTTITYTHNPEDIGIKDPGVVHTWEQLFSSLPEGQKTLNEYID